MQADEDEAIRRLGEAFEIARRWEKLTGQPSGAWMVASQSDLAADDELSQPFGVSSAAWAAIVAAVSHLGVLRDSLFHRVGANEVQAQLHTHGQFTLVRGALENGSMALWLLEPDNSAERILRRMQADWNERRELDVVVKEMNTALSKTKEVYKREVVELLTHVGADPAQLRRWPGYGEVVKTAGAKVPAGSKKAFVVWKVCSALAHGELRGMVAYLDRHQVDELSTADAQLHRVTASVPLLTRGAMTAITTTKAALDLYSRRSGTPLPI